MCPENWNSTFIVKRFKGNPSRHPKSPHHPPPYVRFPGTQSGKNDNKSPDTQTVSTPDNPGKQIKGSRKWLCKNGNIWLRNRHLGMSAALIQGHKRTCQRRKLTQRAKASFSGNHSSTRFRH